MEMLYDWILKLSFFTVLGTVILQMVPDHGFQRYVRFFIGLIMAVMLIGPVLELFDKRTKFDEIYQNVLQKLEADELEGKRQKVIQDLQNIQIAESANGEDIMQAGDSKGQGKKEENRKIEVERIEVGEVSK